MVINDREQIVEATQYSPYGMMEPVAGISTAELNAREKFTTKEYDEEGADFGKLDIDVTLNFGTGDSVTLDPALYNAFTVYYADYGDTAYDRSEYDPIVFEVDAGTNTAHAKGTINYTADREIKWIHLQVNCDNDATPVTYDRNCAIDGINEAVGPGTKMTITRVIGSSAVLINDTIATMPKSFLTYPTEVYDVSGIQAYYFGARYYDPVVGRWMSTDPKSQFSDAYLYSFSNPINAIDPDGNWGVVGGMIGWSLGLGAGGFLLGGASGYLDKGEWDMDRALIGGGVGLIAGAGIGFFGSENFQNYRMWGKGYFLDDKKFNSLVMDKFENLISEYDLSYYIDNIGDQEVITTWRQMLSEYPIEEIVFDPNLSAGHLQVSEGRSIYMGKYDMGTLLKGSKEAQKHLMPKLTNELTNHYLWSYHPTNDITHEVLSYYADLKMHQYLKLRPNAMIRKATDFGGSVKVGTGPIVKQSLLAEVKNLYKHIPKTQQMEFWIDFMPFAR